jgi:hypothetical protein
MTAYTAICEREDGWWVVTVPELESGRVTQARTLDEVPETVADLVSTMTGADPATVQVNLEAQAGPGLPPAEPPGPHSEDWNIEDWNVETLSMSDGSQILYLAPRGLTDAERRARERMAREFVAEMREQERLNKQHEHDEQDEAGYEAG